MTDISNTLLLTGLPRAGTTLCCHILNDYSNVLALHEPLTPTDFDASKGRDVAVAQIVDFAHGMRHKVLTTGIATSRLKDGKVPENPVGAATIAGLRQIDVSLGEMDVSAHVKSDDFTLVIKHNALFTGLLPELAQVLPVFAVVRNPLAVLASWNQVDLPVNQGHIPAGEMFCPSLRETLASIPDRIDRQLYILEWFCERFRAKLSGRVLCYEEFVADASVIGRRMELKTSCQGNLLSRTNRNSAYDLPLMEELYGRLIGFGDAIWSFYSRDQVAELMESIRANKSQ